MADNSVFITGVADGAFEQALGNLPPWATDETADRIAGILEKTLKLQTDAFKDLVKSAGGSGGLSPADAKKFTKSLSDAADIMDEDRKNHPKDKKWWRDNEDEHDKLRKRWKEIAAEYPKTTMALAAIAAAGLYIKDVFVNSVNTYDKMNKAGINLVAGFSGVSSGFQGLQQLTALTGVRFTELSETMMKFSSAINAFGASKFAKTVGMSSKGLAEFGYSSKEAAELLGEYLSVQQGITDVTSKTEAETTKDLQRFAGNINKLSLATGMSRAAILANLEAISKTTDASVLQGQAGTAAANSTLEFISSIKDQNFGKTLLKMMTDQIKPLNQTFSSFQKIGQGGFGQKLMAFTQSIKGMDPESARQAMKTFEEQNHAQIEYGKQQANFYSQIPELAGEANAALEVYTKLQQTGRETVKVSDEDLAKLKETNKARAGLASAWEKLLSSLQKAFAPTIGMLNILTAGLDALNWVIDGLIAIIPDGVLAWGGAIAVIVAVVAGLSIFKSGLGVVAKALSFFTDKLFGAGKGAGKGKGSGEWTTSLGADGSGGLVGGAPKKGGMDFLDKLGGQLASIGKGLGQGIGGLLEGFMKGLAAGLKSLADPKVFIGILALTGIAIAAAITGKAFKDFGDMNWEAVMKGFVAISGLAIIAGVIGANIEFVALGALAIAGLAISISMLGAALKGFPTSVIPDMSGAFEGLGGIIGDVFGGIFDVVSEVFGFIKDIFMPIISDIGDAIKSVYSGIWSVISGIGKAIGAVFSGIWSAVSWVFNSIWNVITGIASIYADIFNGISTVISTVFGGIWSVISGVYSKIWGGITAVGGFISSIFGGLGDILTAPFTFAGKIIGGILDGIKAAISAILSPIKWLADKIGGLFSSSAPPSATTQLNGMVDSAQGLTPYADTLSTINGELLLMSDTLSSFAGLTTIQAIVDTINGIDTVKALAFGALSAMGVSLPAPTPTTGVSASASPKPSTLDSPSTVSTVVESSEQAPVKESTSSNGTGIEKTGSDSGINSALSYQSSVLDQVSQGIKDLISVNQEILKYAKVQS
jgi:hypothetical protein